MSVKLKFDLNKFTNEVKNLEESKELNEAQKDGHRIISTIADYIDCSAEFIMSITKEGLEKAFEIADIDNTNYLQGMAAASRVNGLAKNTETLKRPIKNDLF